MSAQRLNARSTRRLGRVTGLGDQIVRAWGHGGYVHDFVATGHRHGWVDISSGEWGWADRVTHYTTCAELFPDQAVGAVP